jgi:hypothetical protein
MNRIPKAIGDHSQHSRLSNKASRLLVDPLILNLFPLHHHGQRFRRLSNKASQLLVDPLFLNLFPLHHHSQPQRSRRLSNKASRSKSLVDPLFLNLSPKLCHISLPYQTCQPKQQLSLPVNQSPLPTLLVQLHSLSLRHLICQLKWLAMQSKSHVNDIPIAIEPLYHQYYPLNHHLKCCLYGCLPKEPKVRPIRNLAPRPVRVRQRCRARFMY